MTEPKTLSWRWLIPATVGVAVSVCVLMRTSADREVPVLAKRSPRMPEPVVVDQDPEPVQVARPAPPPVAQTDDRENEREFDAVQLRTTYQNFRTAVATDNPPLQQALKPVLARRHRDALKLAQEESDRAATPLDREIARRTLEALRK